MSSNDKEKKDTDESSNKSKSDHENTILASRHSSIVTNINNQNDNISDISEPDSKRTKI